MGCPCPACREMDHVTAWVEGEKVPRPDDEQIRSVIRRLLAEKKEANPFA